MTYYQFIRVTLELMDKDPALFEEEFCRELAKSLIDRMLISDLKKLIQLNITDPRTEENQAIINDPDSDIDTRQMLFELYKFNKAGVEARIAIE